MENIKPHSKPIRLFYFWAGIIATVAYRVIIIFTDQQIFWLRLCWYIGTIGFVIYFIHRYEISEKRRDLLIKYQLDKKVDNLNLNSDEKESLSYILKSLVVSSERLNYIVIFVTSAIALLLGVYLDFIK